MAAVNKYDELMARLEGLDSVLVAYSGGVDSTLLAFCAHAVLGDRCKAVLATSDTYPAHEIDAARELARGLNFNLLEVDTYELADPRFAANPVDRCYYCKSELFTLLKHVADVNGLATIADGSNADDVADHRPGARAASECSILSPLRDVGMTKSDIRALARELGLPNWDKPSMACLASRFPYGEQITEESLVRVARSEAALRDLGFAQLRVRAHGDLARVEVDAAAMESAWAMRERIVAALKNAGFVWVALDLEGFRSGSLNAALDGSVHEGH